MATDDRSSDRVLICRSRGTQIALPLEHVIEMMRPLPIEPIGGAPPFVLGLALVRGEAIPVVDAARLLGGSSSDVTRFVILRSGARNTALAVDSVLGVRTLPRGARQALPPLLSELEGDLVSAIGRLDADLLVVLNSARIVSESAGFDG